MGSRGKRPTPSLNHMKILQIISVHNKVKGHWEIKTVKGKARKVWVKAVPPKEGHVRAECIVEGKWGPETRHCDIPKELAGTATQQRQHKPEC